MKADVRTDNTNSCGALPERKTILMVVPLPPPMNGQALASQVFADELKNYHDVVVVNTAKRRLNSWVDRLQRLLAVARLVWQVRRHRSAADVIYLTISESFLGNLKDLLTYLVCLPQLPRMYIHLHGGAGMARIMRGKLRVWACLNQFFIKRMKGVIVLGKTHQPLFEGATTPQQVHIVPNFAEDHLFMRRDEISAKFRRADKIRLLFLSNLIRGKGHEELLDAYLSLEEKHRSRLMLDIAGGFNSESSKRAFLAKIDQETSIVYHGVVKGNDKRRLFHDAHVFCLPTYYPYEGQPISILEAYASGCAVLTTNHSGIGDIFTHGINGYQVATRSPTSIAATLRHLVCHREQLVAFALRNNDVAWNEYRTSIYNDALTRVMDLARPSLPNARRAA